MNWPNEGPMHWPGRKQSSTDVFPQEAAKQWRDDPAEFKKKARKCVRDSLEW